MTRKSKLEAKQPKKKFKPLVIDVIDDENFNWLHSGRTPEEKERDGEVLKQFEKTLERLKREEALRRESEEISESSQASALQRRMQQPS